MRKILFSTIIASFLYIISCFQQLQAQACNVDNITVKLNSANQVGGTCQINIDLSWDQVNNGGNKYTNIHLWLASNYPNPSLTYGTPPTATQLQNTLGTIVIKDPTLANPTLHNVYANAPSTTMLTATSVQKVYVSGNGINTVNRFTVKGVQFTVAGSCSNAINIMGDLWSSNSNSNNAVQCFIKGGSFIANDPTVTGQILCTIPRQFVVNISSLNTTAQDATFIVYADLAPLGTLDASDPVIYTSGTISIPPSGSGFYTSGPIPNTTQPNDNLWVRVQVTGLSFSTSALITNSCAVLLPVNLRSFTAQRQSESLVLLKWETATEQNNKGFEVQRKMENGEFQTIAFVPSASGGNSSSILHYQFEDANKATGYSQYRLAQVDFDGKQTISQIVLVKGTNSEGIAVLLYPNPSPDGNLTLSFGSTDRKDIQLTDGSGRIIKMQSGITASQYRLTGLKSGMYFLKILQPSTGESRTEKIIVR